MIAKWQRGFRSDPFRQFLEVLFNWSCQEVAGEKYVTLFGHFWRTLDFSSLQMHNSQMSDDNTQRIEKLESHVAHLEHQVEQLNDVVVEQGKLLDKLRKEVQRLSGSLQTLELERVRSNVQKPPHYQ